MFLWVFEQLHLLQSVFISSSTMTLLSRAHLNPICSPRWCSVLQWATDFVPLSTHNFSNYWDFFSSYCKQNLTAQKLLSVMLHVLGWVDHLVLFMQEPLLMWNLKLIWYPNEQPQWPSCATVSLMWSFVERLDDTGGTVQWWAGLSPSGASVPGHW